MNKYKIVKFVCRGQYTTFVDVECSVCGAANNLGLEPDVLKGARVGDVVREYRDKGTDMPLAYTCNDNIQMLRRPLTDTTIRQFADSHFTWMDKMCFLVAMRRALRKNKIKPALSFEKNLRMVLENQIAR